MIMLEVNFGDTLRSTNFGSFWSDIFIETSLIIVCPVQYRYVGMEWHTYVCNLFDKEATM